eukprot:SAG31_NODE_38104_length_299_cov_0.440000_1_plen_59_part_01
MSTQQIKPAEEIEHVQIRHSQVDNRRLRDCLIVGGGGGGGGGRKFWAGVAMGWGAKVGL